MNLLRIVTTAALLATTAFAEIAVKSGEKIGFLGDSITQAGWGNKKAACISSLMDSRRMA
jgi:hypothetical protein